MASNCGSNTKPKTRNDTKVWLIGPTIQTLAGGKLPSIGDVMSVFFYHHKVNKETIKESAKQVIKKVLPFWEMARIATCLEIRARRRVEKQFKKWMNLKKSSSRKTEIQQKQEKVYKEGLSELFDIAHANALTMTNIEEERQFLLAQRDGRRGHMGTVD